VTSNDEQVFPYYRSPAAIRNEAFSRRMRGLDEEEVREYLDLLADQVQSADNERLEMRAENERLQAENQRLQAELQDARSRLNEVEHVGDRVNDQVVELFSQAQLVAEEMVEDLSRDARQRLTQARAQERQILQEAMETAERTRREAEAMIARTVPGSAVGSPLPPGSSGEVEHVRSFARAAQQQMQQIMDAFASQVARLGDAPPAGDSGFGAPYLNGSSDGAHGWQIESRHGNTNPWGSD
jgi:DivIVA domain-containing protein